MGNGWVIGMLVRLAFHMKIRGEELMLLGGIFRQWY